MNRKKDIAVLIVVPCFNEEHRLKTEAFLRFSIDNPNIHFLFVNDGSTDNTAQILRDLCQENHSLNYISFDANRGKAEAVRQGVLFAQNELDQYDFIGFLDADLSTPLFEINNFISAIALLENIKFVLGIRVIRLGAIIEQNRIRYYLSRIFANLAGLVLNESLFDTQCGAKLIHTSVAPRLFEEAFISKWLFDVELIARFKILFSGQPDHVILEHPLEEWRGIKGSKIKKRHFLNVPYHLIKIWFKYRKDIKKSQPLTKQ
ncbi:glycosyltransferase [Hyunsoonleella sp. SJ7]|uniref:Glycosyltransferase n=1 Tax=Hyunsoonleella aquatilis TaxID=2762758 RepID=A0A923HDK3_9FLAO|nr:glycosyltransferase [Hyunsoonleella aquatilis]MBC3757470.1 glycosyltransferase [Hyunsoonleella aquatilis]